MNTYAIAHLIHLFCAIIFVGGVFFEALILSVLHSQRVSRPARKEVEQAISHRATRVMPWVVAGVFLSGLTLLHRYFSLLHTPFQSSFGGLLLLKIIFAFSILLHFVIAVRKMRRQTLTRAWSRYIHTAVLLHMIAIVALAKLMFYWHA